MNLDDSLKIINRQLIESKNRPLNSTEIIILRGIWQYKTYNQIAIEAGYSPGYFTNVAAPELYQRLSKIVAQRVTKKNCRILIEAYVANPVSQINFEKPIENKSLANGYQERSPRYPSCSVSLDSSFYLERSFGKQVERELKKPGALIRIKAPREMGKTSLLLRSLNYANHLGYHTVCLNLEQVEFSVLDEVNLFLRWLCANISQQLQFKPMLDQYWDEDLGSKISSTLYLQDYILESIDVPIVIALDEVNQVFEHPQVAKDFLPLLRSWYEEAKRLPVWQKLRLIVVHSTEIYVPLDLNQSPFNVGLPIQLNDFSLEEVRQLAQRYGLNWQDGEAKQLMSLVGGHPALVNIALYHLSRQEITLSQLLKTATTATGIYAHHLQRHWTTLDNQPELVRLLQMVLDANEPVLLDPSQTHKLSSMGLIKLSGDYAIASCELYRQYFTSKKAIFH
jgi:hypothetical protein